MNSFQNSLGDASFNLKCPCCNKNIDVKTKEVGTTIICPYCNYSIQLPKEEACFKVEDEISAQLDDCSNFVSECNDSLTKHI